MKKGKYEARGASRKVSKKLIAMALALVLCVTGVVGGTLAWLTDKSEVVTNTFSPSDIKIELKETKTDFKMVPGCTIEKDPIVTIGANSEDCWVFIKVEESGNLDQYISYTIDPANWTPLDGVDNVYYANYKTAANDWSFKVLGYTDSEGNFVNNQVLVKDTVTKEMMNALNVEGTTQPTLTFTAYASQMYKNNTETFTPEQAWENISKTTVNAPADPEPTPDA